MDIQFIETILSERTEDFDIEVLKIEYKGKTFFAREVIPCPIIEGRYVGTSFEVQDEIRRFVKVCEVSTQSEETFTLRADHLTCTLSKDATGYKVWEAILGLWTAK